MLENVYEGLNAQICKGRSNQKNQKNFCTSALGVYFLKVNKLKVNFSKCISAKCTRLACLLSFASLFQLASNRFAIFCLEENKYQDSNFPLTLIFNIMKICHEEVLPRLEYDNHATIYQGPTRPEI